MIECIAAKPFNTLRARSECTFAKRCRVASQRGRIPNLGRQRCKSPEKKRCECSLTHNLDGFAGLKRQRFDASTLLILALWRKRSRFRQSWVSGKQGRARSNDKKGVLEQNQQSK